VLLHPQALSRLALAVLELDRKKFEDKRKASGNAKPVGLTHSRWVLGIENEVREREREGERESQSEGTEQVRKS
jgi:hypothetical protein